MRPFLARMRAEVARRLLAHGEGSSVIVSAVLLALAAHLVHFLFFCLPQPWYIEDSAISFAYARNLVDGHGLVPYVGGERIEGYSNALWTFLLAGCYAIGITPWTASKVLGGFFGAAAQLFAFGIAWRGLPERQKWIAVLAPWLLAGSTQFALWNASGLENSLFCVLLSAGIYRLIVEVEDDDPLPLSALAFFGLTMTRPDGLAYAGIGLIARTMGSVARRQGKAWVYWVLAFAVPWAAYFTWRFEYFGWEWPQTWYAKREEFKPTDWNQNGWKQMRDYMLKYGIVWALPLIAMGVAGFERWRKALVLTLLAALLLVVAWDGRAGIPASMKSAQTAWLGANWSLVRVTTVSLAAAVLGLASFGQKGWLVRGILWCCYAFGLFYTILARGDWMKAYRWFSLTSIPQFVLITIGTGVLLDLIPFAEVKLWRKLKVGGVLAVAPTVALIVAAIPRTNEFLLKPETAPRDVHKRADYMGWVQNRLDLDRVTLLDVDMGAHLWWTDWFISDIAGLVDVPMAQHQYEKPFLKEYLFEEVRPMFAHVHGSWMRTMKIESHEEWAEQYIQIPGYPSGKTKLHIGNHVRKDLLVSESPPTDTTRRVNFGSGLRLEWWDVPSPTVAPGGELFVDSRWRSPKRDAGLRVLLFLAKDGAVAWSGEVAPGYDWYRADVWSPWEYVRGGWSVLMPKKLPEGDYQVGLVVLDEKTGAVLPFGSTGIDGTNLWGDGEAPPGEEPAATPDAAPASPDAEAPPSAPPDGATPGPAAPAPVAAPASAALFMVGEYVFPTVVHIVSAEAAQQEAERVLEAGRVAGAAGDCESAEVDWKNARRHVALDTRWEAAHRDAAEDGIVACYVARAKAEKDDLVAAALLARARFISPANPRLDDASAPVAERLLAAGRASASALDWDTSFKEFLAAVHADPRRSDARRLAEDARDRRFKLRAYDPKKGTKDPETAVLPTGIPFWDPSPAPGL